MDAILEGIRPRSPAFLSPPPEASRYRVSQSSTSYQGHQQPTPYAMRRVRYMTRGTVKGVEAAQRWVRSIFSDRIFQNGGRLPIIPDNKAYSERDPVKRQPSKNIMSRVQQHLAIDKRKRALKKTIGRTPVRRDGSLPFYGIPNVVGMSL